MSADALREALAGPVTDLLPCPFCGGEAAYAEGHVDHWYVRCSACGLRHPTLVVRERDPRPKLIAAWNRRATLDTQAARIAELEAENARLREALEAIADGDVPRPTAKPFRNDGVWSKADRCAHDRFMYEDCGTCLEVFARAALQGGQP